MTMFNQTERSRIFLFFNRQYTSKLRLLRPFSVPFRQARFCAEEQNKKVH